MTSHKVKLTPLAIDDMIALHRWIADEADHVTADGYRNRLEARIAALVDYPRRGTPRDDFGPGVRTLSFERRIVIAYRVQETSVIILRIINPLRDLGPLMNG